MASDHEFILIDKIEPLIIVIRGERVLLDSDLAELYGVGTKVLNQAVKRNLSRFPVDFMFQLSSEETENLRSRIVTSRLHGGRRYLPYAFTEHGAIMAAAVLNSPRAVEVSIFVVRAFVKLRQWIQADAQLAAKLTQLERKVIGHDESIRELVAAIRQLMPSAANTNRRKIGFRNEQ